METEQPTETERDAQDRWDRFAAAAITGLIAGDPDVRWKKHEILCERAAAIADAMVAKRG